MISGLRHVDRFFAWQMAAVVLSIMAVNMLRPFVTYRAVDLGAGPVEVGWLAASFAVAPALVALPIGRAIDRYGEVRFILFALAALVLGGVLGSQSRSLGSLLLAQVISGLGHSTNLIAQQALIANRAHENRDERYGMFSTMAALGQFAGPLVAAALVVQTSVKDSATVVANSQAPAFIGASCAALLAVFSVVIGLRQSGSLFGQASTTQTVSPLERVGLLTAARQAVVRPGMPSAMLVSMAVVASIDVLIAYLPLYGETHGLGVETVGMLLAARAAASMTSRIFLGYLIARVGRSRLLAAGLTTAALALAMLPFVPSEPALFAAMALIGFGLGLGQPITTAWVAGQSSRADRATALSVRTIGNRVATMIVPAAIGVVAGAGGLVAGFWLLSAMLAIAGRTALVAPLKDPASL